MAEKKVIYLITGPIGAGKSTYAKCLIDYCNLSSLEYICADLYYSLYFKNTSKDDNTAYAKAKKFCSYKLNKAISSGRSFIWETVIAKETKIEILKSIIAQGYILKCAYIGMSNHITAIERVAKRHAQGWYTVPDTKVIDRYQKTTDNLAELIRLSDTMVVIDSTSDQGKVVMWKEAQIFRYYNNSCKWLPNQSKVKEY